MNIRETMEQFEKEHLSPYASLSCNSKGREIPEEECDIRPVYQRDRDRILHCKSFRRMKHKTQVFLAPEGDHYRTRLTHTLEVSQNARTIAKALRLNEDLVEAIALGHDLGHTPFGHCGESALNEVCPEGFEHNIQSVRVVRYLEKQGQGLNLTWEVRDGIENHQIKSTPATLEGKIVRLSDKIAYINHDIDDAIRAQVIAEEDIPREYREILGDTTRKRLDTLIHSIIIESMDKDDILMDPEVEEAMKGLRRFMFDNVYTNPNAKAQEKKARDLIVELYEYYNKHFELLSPKYSYVMEHYNQSKERVVCDYIAGMTDQYAILRFQELRVPISWKIK
ncbi:MAG: deoxyguanosinetriphosphate triphosphohydrolase [Lachnospiraceae bacterium]|nr:deoxyguanosinetriphosphate triphosphohydrolase [Lachnospiraceae bacterium]